MANAPSDFRSLYSDPNPRTQAAMRERIIREDYGITAAKSSKEYRTAARHIQLLANGERKSSRKEEYVAVDNRLKVQYDRNPLPPVGGRGGGRGRTGGHGSNPLPTAFYLTGTIEYGGKVNRKTKQIETVKERRRNSRMDVKDTITTEQRAELQRIYDTQGYDAAWFHLFFLLTGYKGQRVGGGQTEEGDEQEDSWEEEEEE